MRGYVCLMLAVGLFGGVVYGATLEVGSGQTYSTVSDAYAAAVSDDVINIHAGTYTSMTDLSGSGKEGITFQSNGSDKVVFDLSDDIYLRYDDNDVFDGIVFDARDTGDYAVYLRSDARHTTFRNCVFYGADTAALYAYDTSGHWVSDIKVEHCTFYDNGIGIRGAGEAYLGDGNGEIKDNLFVNNTTGIDNDGKDPLTVKYSAFWGNATNTDGNNTVTLGTGTITDAEPIFISTTLSDPDFLVLSLTAPIAITRGDSEGGFMGARGLSSYPVCGDPGTELIGDFAGAGGVGEAYRDCRVDLLDFAAVASLWLDCTDPSGEGCLGDGASMVNVKTDLVKWRIFARGAEGDGAADDSMAIQAAIDYMAAQGGGTVYVPAGTYIASGLVLDDNVTLEGAGIDQTVFRPADREAGIMLTGSDEVIRDFTYYGSEADHSGDNWDPDTAAGVLTNHNISVIDAVDCEIINVKSLECRYDPLRLADSSGVHITSCHFNRAGRNIVSVVNSSNWTFTDSYFGNLWCLYHFDMENVQGEGGDGSVIENGLFTGCTFDGVGAGSVAGTTDSANMLIFVADSQSANKNITVDNCTFNDIQIRVDNANDQDNAIFPDCTFTNNTIDIDNGAVFVSVYGTGVFDNATVSGNTFLENGAPTTLLTDGATFTNSTFTGNTPDTWDD